IEAGHLLGEGIGLVFTDLPLTHPVWILAFALTASAVFGCIGIIAGMWADKFDHLAGVQNFLIVPLTFLSGVFYSIHSLPTFWQTVSHWNPVFFMIDGFRHGFFGQSDVNPWTGLAVVLPCALALALVTLLLLRRGYKLRH
ncbi:MAG: ABC transporter permease, partial [Thiobacillaceae bacterium]